MTSVWREAAEAAVAQMVEGKVPEPLPRANTTDMDQVAVELRQAVHEHGAELAKVQHADAALKQAKAGADASHRKVGRLRLLWQLAALGDLPRVPECPPW